MGLGLGGKVIVGRRRAMRMELGGDGEAVGQPPELSTSVTFVLAGVTTLLVSGLALTVCGSFVYIDFNISTEGPVLLYTGLSLFALGLIAGSILVTWHQKQMKPAGPAPPSPPDSPTSMPLLAGPSWGGARVPATHCIT